MVRRQLLPDKCPLKTGIGVSGPGALLNIDRLRSSQKGLGSRLKTQQTGRLGGSEKPVPSKRIAFKGVPRAVQAPRRIVFIGWPDAGAGYCLFRNLLKQVSLRRSPAYFTGLRCARSFYPETLRRALRWVKVFLFDSLAHLKNAGKTLTADRSTTELRWIFFPRSCGA